MRRRASAVLLALIAVGALSLVGGAAAYLNLRGTQAQVSAREASKILIAARSGAERALTRIRMGNFGNFTGEVDGIPYTVTITQDSSDPDLFHVTSVAERNGVKRTVFVDAKRVYTSGGKIPSFGAGGWFSLQGTFRTTRPFASTFTLGTNTGFSANGVYDLKNYNVKFVDAGGKTPASLHDGDTSNGELIPYETSSQNFFFPKVSQANVTVQLPNPAVCDYGSFFSDYKITKSTGYRDLNGDGQVVICGDNVLVERDFRAVSSDVPVVKIYSSGDINIDKDVEVKNSAGEYAVVDFFAQGNININGEVTAHGRKGPLAAEIVANGDINFNGGRLQLTGRTDDTGYDFLLYSGGNINFNSARGNSPLHLTGRHDQDILIAAKGTINNNGNDWITADSGKGSAYFLIWNDGSANLGVKSLKFSGGSAGRNPTVRKISVLSGGSLVLGNVWLTGSFTRDKLTVDDIKAWANETQDPDLRKLLQSFIDQISSGSSVSWQQVHIQIQKWAEF